MTHWGIVWCVVSKVRAQRSDYYLKQNLSCCAPWKLHKDWNLLKQVLSIWKALMQWSVGCRTWRDQKKKAQSLSIPASCVAVADVATTIPRTVNSSIQHATIVPKKGDIALACRAKKMNPMHSGQKPVECKTKYVAKANKMEGDPKEFQLFTLGTKHHDQLQLTWEWKADPLPCKSIPERLCPIFQSTQKLKFCCSAIADGMWWLQSNHHLCTGGG